MSKKLLGREIKTEAETHTLYLYMGITYGFGYGFERPNTLEVK